MGVPRGVTLIVGGSYHGKSTLLKAIESGVYDHVAGDGRELVVCDDTAVKLRAEDGRSVRGSSISLFINNLPNDADTVSFWTEDASGSTSQAASTIEAAEARRARASSTRTPRPPTSWCDELMQSVVSRENEPITPFVERLRDLYERARHLDRHRGGLLGAFFSVADTVIQMDSYKPLRHHRARARDLHRARREGAVAGAPGFAMPREPRHISAAPSARVKTASLAKRENAGAS